MPSVATSYTDAGIPQDLWPSIRDLDALNYYVTSNAGSVEVKQKTHQWENDPISVVQGQNTVAEGVDTQYTNTDGVLQTNYVEIIERGPKVSGTDVASLHPAIGNRWDREKLKRMKEWKNQLEYDAINGVAYAGAGPGSVSSVTIFAGGSYTAAPTTVTFSPPPTGGTQATGTPIVSTVSPYMVTGVAITNPGLGYVAPPQVTISGGTGSGASAIAVVQGAARTMAGMVNMIGGLTANGVTTAGNVGNNNGTLTTLTPTMLNAYLGQSDSYGATIDTILVNATLKSRISGFTAGNTRNVDASSGELVGRVDVYDSDFGRVKIVYHRNIVTTGLLGYISDYFLVGFLTPMHWEDRAITGYFKAGAYVGEPSCQLSNPLAGLYYTYLQ